MFSGTAQFSHQVFQFFASSVCLLVRVTVVDKSKAVFLFVSHIDHNVIRKEEKIA